MTSPSRTARPSAATGATDATSTSTATDTSGAIETLAGLGEGVGMVMLQYLVSEERKAEFEAIIAAAEADLRTSIETVQAGADLRADELAATQTASALAHADLGYTVLNVQARADNLFGLFQRLIDLQEKLRADFQAEKADRARAFQSQKLFLKTITERLVEHAEQLTKLQADVNAEQLEKLQAEFKAEQAAKDAKIAAQDAKIAALEAKIATQDAETAAHQKDLADLRDLVLASGRVSVQEGQQE